MTDGSSQRSLRGVVDGVEFVVARWCGSVHLLTSKPALQQDPRRKKRRDCRCSHEEASNGKALIDLERLKGDRAAKRGATLGW